MTIYRLRYSVSKCEDETVSGLDKENVLVIARKLARRLDETIYVSKTDGTGDIVAVIPCYCDSCNEKYR